MNSTITPVTPRNLLEAVNELLAAIRMSSILSFATEHINEDASDAKMAIDGASIQVQQEGWFFNREQDLWIDPEENTNYVYIPRNALRVSSARTFEGARLVERGNRLYDPRKHTFEIPNGAKVDCVVGLEFSDLPSIARSYITAVAARAFCTAKLPTSATVRYTEDYVQNCRNLMEQLEADYADDTLVQTNPHILAMRKR